MIRYFKSLFIFLFLLFLFTNSNSQDIEYKVFENDTILEHCTIEYYPDSIKMTFTKRNKLKKNDIGTYGFVNEKIFAPIERIEINHLSSILINGEFDLIKYYKSYEEKGIIIEHDKIANPFIILKPGKTYKLTLVFKSNFTNFVYVDRYMFLKKYCVSKDKHTVDLLKSKIDVYKSSAIKIPVKRPD